MARLALRALALAPVLVAGAALAHPGHSNPHLLNEGDAILGWWLAGVLGVAAAFVVVLGKSRD